jgi:ABC-type multidrug transport system fused ATPase/permease subunit
LSGQPTLANYWHPICVTTEVTEQPRHFTLLGEQIAAYRDSAGPVAMRDINSRPAPAAGPIVEVSGVSLAFGGMLAVNDMSIAVSPGEILAIVGPNGAGKSSLVEIISGAMKPRRGKMLGGVMPGESPENWPAASEERPS